MPRSFAGLRIRERRKQLQLSQTALAKAAGISASYLNLIEHNRRPVAGRVMLTLAKALDVPPSALSEKAELGMVATLRSAAADLPVHQPETDLTEEFLGRYPGWARLLSTLDQTARAQRQTIEALSDRLTHDPTLQANMHEMLTTITAIRSTSSILATVPDIEAAQRARFVDAIHGESERLSKVASALTGYFDAAVDQEERAATPEEELATALAAVNYDFPELEREDSTPDAALQRLGSLSDQARSAALAWLTRWQNDARAAPRAAIAAAFERPVDLIALAGETGTSIDQLMRRIAFLDMDAVPEVGLLGINAAGQYLLRRPVADWPLSRTMAACPLWPVFDSVQMPERLSAAIATYPSGQRAATLSFARRISPDRMQARSRFEATMLILPAEAENRFILGHSEQIEAGPGCRICPRASCPARSAPPIIDLAP